MLKYVNHIMHMQKMHTDFSQKHREIVKLFTGQILYFCTGHSHHILKLHLYTLPDQQQKPRYDHQK